jgi:alkanesulfonate monooxygenase SsuD/methylene tetrahydromethanopterin reductase-like flavin-dependent oxidoreductase (luciferase family)
VKIGIALPHYGTDADVDLAITLARRVEDLGFDSLWVSDHIVFDLAKYGGSDALLGSLEPLSTLAALSRETTRVRLGTMVLCNEFRHPLMVAKEAMTIDRLELGIGAGWYEREFTVAGLPYPSARVRMERLRESVEILRAALNGKSVTFAGKHYSVDGFVLGANLDTTIWVGGKGDRMLQLIADVADNKGTLGWNAAWFQDVESYLERARLLGDAKLKRSVGQYARGTPQEMIDRLRGFADAGVEHAIMCFSEVPFGLDDPDDLARFSDQVLPHVR